MSSAKKSTVRVNEAITAPEVLLVDPDGLLAAEGQAEYVGKKINSSTALKVAKHLKKDLVEVSPNARPPVVRVMDYGKYRYQEQKKVKKQKPQKIKEIKLRPATGEGDYQVKLRNLMGFLAHGDKVKVTLRFKGREIAHKDLANELLDRLKADIAGVGNVDQEARFEGRQMIMVISPKK